MLGDRLIWVRALRFGAAATVAGIVLYLAHAFPTHLYTSPAGYTAQSIARGSDLFTVYCAVCHGMEGRGNGLAGKDLNIKPANLTSRHTYLHADGTVFSWITNGIGELMPAFRADLDDDARWNLVDFIRANADGARIRGLVTSEAFPVPNFAARCLDGSTISLDDQRGRIIHLVLAGRDSRLADSLARLDLGRDVATIVVPLEAPAAADKTACVADDPDVIKAFAPYRGRDSRLAERMDFLVDAAGLLHSIWYPGIDWDDAAMLRRHIDEIR